VAGAIATADTVFIDHARIKIDNGVSDLDRGFLFNADRLDGSCRADLRAICTFRAAISAVV
jgi:hypothetical protein